MRVPPRTRIPHRFRAPGKRSWFPCAQATRAAFQPQSSGRCRNGPVLARHASPLDRQRPAAILSNGYAPPREGQRHRRVGSSNATIGFKVHPSRVRSHTKPEDPNVIAVPGRRPGWQRNAFRIRTGDCAAGSWRRIPGRRPTSVQRFAATVSFSDRCAPCNPFSRLLVS